MKTRLIVVITLFLSIPSFAQNVGVGTAAPDAKLHVNGDLKLQNGFAVNKFSRDSMFTENSHNNVPTEKAIKDYIQRGIWGTATDSTAIGSQAPVPRGFSRESYMNGPVSVARQGSYAFIACYNGDQLVSYNVNNPDSIYFRDDITTNLDGPVDVFTQGNFAYVVNEINDRLCIFDISNPAVITARGFITTNIRRPTSVFVQGNYAYVTSDLLNRLSIFDISNPDAIVAKGSIGTNMSLPAEVFVQGNFAYVASRANNRLCIYDISNPDAIVARGFTSAGLTDPLSLHVQGDYAYVTSRNNVTGSRIRIYNISNPDVITLASSISNVVYMPLKLHVNGNVLTVADAFNTIWLFNVSNPLAPSTVGYTTTNLNGLNYVFSTGDYIYATSYSNNRLCVYDLNRVSNVQVTPAGIQTAPVLWQSIQNNIYRGNGNVGIGTSNPLAKLNVAGQIFVEQDQAGGYGGLLIRGNAPGSNYPNIGFAVNNGVNYAGAGLAALIQGDIVDNGNGTEKMDISFHTADAGQYSLAEKMRIRSNGNIGIGHTVPNGNLQFSNALNNRKIVLYEAQNNDHQYYGIGLNSGVLRYQVDATSASHIFYAGLNSTSSSELMRISGSGFVGIGNTAPTRPLSFPAALGEKILLYPGVNGEVGMGVYGNELRLHCDNPGSKVSFGTQDNAGNFTEAAKAQISGAYAFSIFGSLWANGTTYASDERFKQNITPIASPLQKLLRINGVEYEMRTTEFAKNHFQPGRQIGLLAQNVEQIIPEAVNELDGYKGVDYARLVPLLVESIKAQQQQIQQQQAEMTEMKKTIQLLLKKK